MVLETSPKPLKLKDLYVGTLSEEKLTELYARNAETEWEWEFESIVPFNSSLTDGFLCDKNGNKVYSTIGPKTVIGYGPIHIIEGMGEYYNEELKPSDLGCKEPVMVNRIGTEIDEDFNIYAVYENNIKRLRSYIDETRDVPYFPLLTDIQNINNYEAYVFSKTLELYTGTAVQGATTLKNIKQLAENSTSGILCNKDGYALCGWRINEETGEIIENLNLLDITYEIEGKTRRGTKIDEDGKIYAIFDDETANKVIGQIVVRNCPNPAALELVKPGIYDGNINSGLSSNGDVTISSYGDGDKKIKITEKIAKKDNQTEKSVIFFTIDNKEYQADAEMTWKEWIESDYPGDDGWKIDINNKLIRIITVIEDGNETEETYIVDTDISIPILDGHTYSYNKR